MERTITNWTAIDGDAVTRDDAQEVWVAEAHRILTRVAGTYRGLIEYGELAAELQETTGIHTRSQVRTWVGPVLAQVAEAAHENNEPPLTSLVVLKSTGMVGAGYDEVMRRSGEEPAPDDLAREKHAARSRLACYEWAGADMPTDGGTAALSPRYAMTEARARKQRQAEAMPTICPHCFMAIPPTGVCDNCG
jgi:hypothetical protein